jgi:L-threonylcarbamoyladenylate synthase
LLTPRIQRKVLTGKILIHPTESCFGIGCHPNNIYALKKILIIKKRSKNKSFLLISDKVQKFFRYVSLSEKNLQHISDWPKHTSYLFKKNPRSPMLLSPKKEKIGCRIPDHKKIKRTLENLNFPITSTSANFSGQISLKLWRHCCRNFSSKSCIIMNERVGNYKRPSTIIDFETKKIIRK